MKRGLTLIELMIVIVLFIILALVTVYIFRAVLLSWSSQETRTGIDINLDRGIEEVVRDLREAKKVQSTAGYDEIRFTPDESTYYIYYLYNENDSYIPPPAFDRDYYELKKAALTDGINGTFTYGGGRIIIRDIVPPGSGIDPKTDLSIDAGNLITIILKIERADETITSKTEVRPRNL